MSLSRTAWTDDDGSGTTGTVLNNAMKTGLYDEIDGRWSELTTTSTGSQNNFSITSASREADVLRCNNATDLTLTGIAAPASPVKPGKRLYIFSVGAGNVFLAHQSGSSTAANQLFNLATSANTPLAAGKGVACYVYDDTADRWRLAFHDQGTWITPTFAAGDYTGSGSLTWTLTGADVTSQTYKLSGRTLQVSFELGTTSTGGTASTELRVGGGAIGNFTFSARTWGPLMYSDNGGARAAGHCIAASGVGYVSCFTSTLGNWSNAATNTTEVRGCISCSVT